MSVPLRGGPRHAFTLPEVMVAVAILTIMVAFLGNLLASVCAISSVGHQDAENSSNARAILDLMSQELESGMNRGDLTNWISWTASPAALTFFTRSVGSAVSPAPASPNVYRGLSCVDYALNRSSTNSFLERGDQSYLWSDAPANGVPLGNANAALPAPARSDVLDGVVVFQVTFLQQDGTYSSTYMGTNSIAAGLSLALVDSGALKALVRAGKVQTLAAALEGAFGASANTVSPKAAWQGAINSQGLAGYPQQVKTGLRFYERFVDLPKATL